MNNFLDLAKSRYSVRKFTDELISEEVINKILVSAQVAPTACNKQPQIIYVIKSKEALQKLQKCKYSNFNEQLAFLICYDKNQCWVREFDNKESGDIDASIIATHMMLEAYENNVGSTFIMHFIPEAVRVEFDLSDNIIPVCILAMGKISDEAKPSNMHYINKDINDFTKIL